MSQSNGIAISKNELLGSSALFSAAFLYGWFGILIRFASEGGVPAFLQIFFRGSLAALILLSILLISRKSLRFPEPKHAAIYLLRSVIGLSSFMFSYYAFINLSIATAYLFFYGGFLLGGFFIGKIVYKETVTRLKMVSLAMSMIGIFFVYVTQLGAGASMYYSLTALLSGVLSVAWSSFPKLLTTKYTDTETNLFDTAFASILGLAISLFMHEKFALPKDLFGWQIQIAFVFQAVTNGQLMIYGFRHVEAQIGSFIMLLEIVFAAIFGYFIFAEIPSVFTVIGSMLIVISSALPILLKPRKRMH